MKYIILIPLIISIYSYTENEKIVWNTLKTQGFTKACLAGILGNIKADSNVRSVYYEDRYKKMIGYTDQEYVDKINSGEYTENQFIKDRAGFGLMLWTYYTRKKALYEMCRGKIGDAECQTRYIILELKTYFSRVYKELKELTDVESCTKRVLFYYESPQLPELNELKKRIEYANYYYKNFE